MATRNTPPPESEAETGGFNEAQRGELRDLIAEVVGGAKPPSPPPTERPGPRQVSDSEWDTMSDRTRESWVRQLVDFRLEELMQADEVRAMRDDLDKLKADKTPEPEAPPSVVTKVQRWLWGEPDRK